MQTMQNLKLRYVTFALLPLVFVASSIGFAYAQKNVTSTPAANTTQSVATSTSQSQATSRIHPFQGQFVKIFSVNNFINEKQWQQIDDLASQGYEIKAIVPASPFHFIVVMQKRG
jgi:hypothetical protein